MCLPHTSVCIQWVCFDKAEWWINVVSAVGSRQWVCWKSNYSSALTLRRGLCSGKQCHFPSAFLQFHKSLHLEKTPHGNEREKVPWNSRQLSSPRLENALGDGENVFDDSESTLYTYRSSKNREIVHLAPRLPEFLLGSDFKNKLIKWLVISCVLSKDSYVAAHDHKEDQKSVALIQNLIFWAAYLESIQATSGALCCEDCSKW